MVAAPWGCSDKEVVPDNPPSCEDFDNGGEGRCEGTCRILDEAFCEDQAVTPDCANIPAGAQVDVCGVAIKAPPSEQTAEGKVFDELERSPNVKEYAGTGPVALGCYEAGGYPPAADPSASQDVTVRGIVKIFSNGCESKDVTVSVYTVRRDGSSEDGHTDQLVGTAVVTPDFCDDTNAEPEPDIEGCGMEDIRYECRYQYDNVPTETELVFVTEGPIWAPIYEYGVFIPNSEVSGGEWEHDVRALANDDYATIAQAAMGKTITAGHGAVAGEVHDCDNLRVVNAVVDVDVPKFITTYFTDDEDDPLPDLQAKSTSTLGLYSALDITPGPATVAAAGIVDGQLVGAGFMRVYVYADAVTSATFRGLKGYQVP